MNKDNYLAQLSAARAAGKGTGGADLAAAMAEVRQYAERLDQFDADELKDLDDLLGKVDSMAGIFDKYAKLQEKIESLKENAALVESSMAGLAEIAETAEVDPLAGYTQDETNAINVQLIEEFAGNTRIAKDLLALSVVQELDVEVPDEVPAFEGLTKEQTVQVYMQVMDEFEAESPLAKMLAYNAGV